MAGRSEFIGSARHIKKLQNNNFSTQSAYVFIHIFKIRITEIYASAVMEMRYKLERYPTIASEIGMTTSMVRRIIQHQEAMPC